MANEEDDKESDEVPEEEDDQDEDEQEERRPLLVPKIYIKKPPVLKDRIGNGLNKEKEERPSEAATPSDESKSDKDASKSDSNALQGTNYSDNVTIKENTHENSSTETSTKPEQGFIKVRDNLETVAKLGSNLADIDPEKMVKMMEEEGYSSRRIQLVKQQIENEKKRKALEEAKKLLGSANSIEIVPVKRGRKPKEIPLKIFHEPIVSNVEDYIRNDDSNDELSEPPGVTLPLLERLSSKSNEDLLKNKGLNSKYLN